MDRTRHLSRGVVLLSILLVLALLAALAYRLMGNHSLLIAQTRLTFGGDVALSYALGAEEMARQVLYQDWENTGADVDDLSEIWAQPLAPFALPEYDNSFLEIQLRDMNNCFNLNAVSGGEQAAENVERLKRLLVGLGIPPELADAWRDWVDDDDQVSGFGAEDGEYLLAEIPYRTPNQRAGDWSEMALLPGIELEQLALLEPLLCALPDDSLSLNVNTVNPRVLEAMVADSAAGSFDNFVESPRNYQSVQEFTAEFSDYGPATPVLAVRSEYFEVHVRALIDGYSIELASLFRRDPTNGAITLIARNLGKQFQSFYRQDAADE